MVEVHIKNKIGGLPGASVDLYDLILESVDTACNTQIRDIVLLGDFNCDGSKLQNNKVAQP